MRLTRILMPTHPAHLALGLTLWIAWFGLVYGGVSLACVWVPPPEGAGPWTWINGSVAISTLAVVAILLAGAWFCWQGRTTQREPAAARRFVAVVAAGLYITAAVATLAVGLPAMRLPPCM